MSSQIAVIGMGVMGRNIALNLADNGYRVAAYNRSPQKLQLLEQASLAHHELVTFSRLEDLVEQIESPRKLLLMLTAGNAVDAVIDQLTTMLQPGDVIIDGGNSNFHDSERRHKALEKQRFLFLGAGISGGEEGARYGPSIMPGGSAEAWALCKPMLQAIAAKTEDGEICCQWVGQGGAGHYVKMIHNGIEYGDMQLIAESWQLMSSLGIDEQRIADTFSQWNEGVLKSYLIEITAEILKVRDPDGRLRVHNILDSAGQKGTGRWTAIDSLELGAPLTLIAEAVYARVLSSFKAEREKAASLLPTPEKSSEVDIDQRLQQIHDALYASKIISYAQGFMQMKMAAQEYGWQLEYGSIALLWRAGCIIRSRFLEDIKKAFDNNPELDNLLLDEVFHRSLLDCQQGWRATCQLGIQHAVPMPSMQSALSFYDGYHSATLSANLLQAQRDYFGAHSYRRIDREGVFHTRWTEDGTEVKNDE